MKILMIGLGSIGQRHVRNLRELYGDRIELIAYRARGHKTTFTDKLEIREGVDLETEYHITSYTDLDEALSQKPKIAFITNITAKHMECALKAAEAGCHLFIEKPLSSSIDGVEELSRIVREKELVVYLGFQNRYHPCIQHTKKLLESGVIGNVCYAESEFSERVTTMHRYEDYRQTYMAVKDMGGGPVNNLQMHDFDLLRYLFGEPAAVSAVLGFGRNLGIDVEESAEAVFRFGSEKEGFPVRSHTDFYQYPPVHRIKAVGSKGRIEADLLSAVCRVYVGDEPAEEVSYADFVRNEMFLTELKEFIGCVESGETKTPIGLEDGIAALKMAMAIKQSAAEHREVRI